MDLISLVAISPTLYSLRWKLKGGGEKKGEEDSGSNADKPFLIRGGFDPLQPGTISHIIGGFEKRKIADEFFDEGFCHRSLKRVPLAMASLLYPFIGLDNILNQGVSDHILFREVDEFNAFDSFEDALDFDQT